MSQLPENGELVIDERQGLFDLLIGQPAPRQCNAQVSSRFVHASCCDTEEVHAVLTPALIAFREIGGNGRSCMHDLLSDLHIMSPHASRHTSQAVNDLQRPFERDKLMSS